MENFTETPQNKSSEEQQIAKAQQLQKLKAAFNKVLTNLNELGDISEQHFPGLKQTCTQYIATINNCLKSPNSPIFQRELIDMLNSINIQDWHQFSDVVTPIKELRNLFPDMKLNSTTKSDSIDLKAVIKRFLQLIESKLREKQNDRYLSAIQELRQLLNGDISNNDVKIIIELQKLLFAIRKQYDNFFDENDEVNQSGGHLNETIIKLGYQAQLLDEEEAPPLIENPIPNYGSTYGRLSPTLGKATLSSSSRRVNAKTISPHLLQRLKNFIKSLQEKEGNIQIENSVSLTQLNELISRDFDINIATILLRTLISLDTKEAVERDKLVAEFDELTVHSPKQLTRSTHLPDDYRDEKLSNIHSDEDEKETKDKLIKNINYLQKNSAIQNFFPNYIDEMNIIIKFIENEIPSATQMTIFAEIALNFKGTEIAEKANEITSLYNILAIPNKNFPQKKREYPKPKPRSSLVKNLFPSIELETVLNKVKSFLLKIDLTKLNKEEKTLRGQTIKAINDSSHFNIAYAYEMLYILSNKASLEDYMIECKALFEEVQKFIGNVDKQSSQSSSPAPMPSKENKEESKEKQPSLNEIIKANLPTMLLQAKQLKNILASNDIYSEIFPTEIRDFDNVVKILNSGNLPLTQTLEFLGVRLLANFEVSSEFYQTFNALLELVKKCHQTSATPLIVNEITIDQNYFNFSSPK